MTTSTERRAEVLDLRIRLEHLAVAAYGSVCHPERERQSEIAERLTFVVGLVEAEHRAGAHRLIRLAGHVYRRSSDVLHGRVCSLGISDDVVAEWRRIVESLERLVADTQEARPTAARPVRARSPANPPPRSDRA